MIRAIKAPNGPPRTPGRTVQYWVAGRVHTENLGEALCGKSASRGLFEAQLGERLGHEVTESAKSGGAFSEGRGWP